MSVEPKIDKAAIAKLMEVVSDRARRDGLIASTFELNKERCEKALAAMQIAWTSLVANGAESTPSDLRNAILEPRAFGRWLALFYGACAELFEPTIADAVSERAEQIAAELKSYIDSPSGTPGGRNRCTDPQL